MFNRKSDYTAVGWSVKAEASVTRSLARSLTHSLLLLLIFLAELVPLLLEKGASLEARNKDKATPLDSSHNKQVFSNECNAAVVVFLPSDFFNVDLSF